MTESERLSAQVKDLAIKVQNLSEEVQSLLDLWNQAKGVVTFVKWAAYISGCIGGFIIFIKPFLKG